MNIDSSILFEPYTLDLLFRVSIILAIAIVLDYFLESRKKYVTSSAVWRAALLAVFILPFAGLVIPSQSGWLKLANETRSTPVISQAVEAFPNETMSVVEDYDKLPVANSNSTEEIGQELEYTANSTQRPSPAVITPSTTSSVESPAPLFGWNWLLLATLTAGWVFFAFRLLVSQLYSCRLIATSEPINDSKLDGQFAALKSELSIFNNVGIRKHSDIRIPMVVGILRPNIVIPSSLICKNELGGINAERVSFKAVVMHELVHVKRQDMLWNVLFRIMKTVFWFHPLACFAESRVSINREKICDDFCVHKLGDSQRYVDTLISMASLLTEKPARGLHLAAIRKPKLASRIAALIQSKGHWQFEASGLTRCAFALASFAGVGLIASQSLFLGDALPTSTQMAVVAETSLPAQNTLPDTGTPKSQPVVNSTPATGANELLPNLDKVNQQKGASTATQKNNDKALQDMMAKHSASRTHWVFGKVTDANGKPVERADISVVSITRQSRTSMSGSTDDWGDFKTSYDGSARPSFFVYKKGLGVFAMKLDSKVMPEQSIQLNPPVETVIDVVDDKGEAIEIRSFDITSFSHKRHNFRFKKDIPSDTHNEMDEESRRMRREMTQPFEKIGREISDLNLLPINIEGNQIRFQVAPDDYGFIGTLVTKEGRQQQIRLASKDNRHEDWFKRKDKHKWKVVLHPPAVISGQATYANGEPIPWAKVTATSYPPGEARNHPSRLNLSSRRSAYTDKDGRYKFELMEPGVTQVHVRDNGRKEQIYSKNVTTRPNQEVTIDVSMIPMVEASGRVLDDKGQPVEGVHVGSYSSSPKAITDKNGRYSVFVPTGDNFQETLYFSKIPDGYIQYGQPQIKLTEDNLETGKLPDYRCTRATNLSGKIIGPYSNPVKNCKIVAFCNQKLADGTHCVDTVKATAEDSADFVLKNVSLSEPVYVFAYASRHSTKGLVKVEPGEQPRIKLDSETRSIRVSGRVTDSKGFPAKGVTVVLKRGIEIPGWSHGIPSLIPPYDGIRVTTDVTGNFSFKQPVFACLSYQLNVGSSFNAPWFQTDEDKKDSWRQFVKITVNGNALETRDEFGSRVEGMKFEREFR